MLSRLVASAANSLPARFFAFLLVSTVTTEAFAQQAAPMGGGSQLLSFVPIIFAFIVMIVFSNYKQKKARTERDAFLSKLDRGEEVITTGGLLGRIEGMTDLYLTLEIAPGTRIKVLRSAVAGLAKNVAPVSTEVKA